MRKAFSVAAVACVLALAVPSSAMALPKKGSLAPSGMGNSGSALAWGVIACVGFVVLAAMNANRVHNRQLDASEIGFCGLNYWLKVKP